MYNRLLFYGLKLLKVACAVPHFGDAPCYSGLQPAGSSLLKCTGVGLIVCGAPAGSICQLCVAKCIDSV